MSAAKAAKARPTSTRWRLSRPIIAVRRPAARSSVRLNQRSGAFHRLCRACAPSGRCLRIRPQSAGVRVSETTAEIITEIAMVRANWL